MGIPSANLTFLKNCLSTKDTKCVEQDRQRQIRHVIQAFEYSVNAIFTTSFGYLLSKNGAEWDKWKYAGKNVFAIH